MLTGDVTDLPRERPEPVRPLGRFHRLARVAVGQAVLGDPALFPGDQVLAAEKGDPVLLPGNALKQQRQQFIRLFGRQKGVMEGQLEGGQFVHRHGSAVAVVHQVR